MVVGGLLGDKYYNAMNVGSTTDYRAHVAIVERYERQKNNRIDNFVGYREIPIFVYGEIFMTKVLKAIGEYGREHQSDPNFQNFIMPMNEWIKEEKSVDLIDASISTLTLQQGNLLEKGFSALGFKAKDALGQEERYRIYMGATILGLNKKYREDLWQEKQTEASASHLRNFVKTFADSMGGNSDDIISCLGFLSGAYECGKLPSGCDFSHSYLKRLCDKPK
jgi:hypothetical protein